MVVDINLGRQVRSLMVVSERLRSFCAGLSHEECVPDTSPNITRSVLVSIISDYIEREVLLLGVNSPSQSVSTRFISEETLRCPQL